MLEELFPVQFVEGINESAEYELDEEYLISMRDFRKVAIGYKPNISSVVSRIDIMIFTSGATQDNIPIDVSVCSDYNGNPSDITLRGSNSFKPKVPKERNMVYWQDINIMPVILVADNPYWIVLSVNGVVWALVLAKDGKTATLKTSHDRRWIAFPESANKRIMLRFYGRVIPFVSPQTIHSDAHT